MKKSLLTAAIAATAALGATASAPVLTLKGSERVPMSFEQPTLPTLRPATRVMEAEGGETDRYDNMYWGWTSQVSNATNFEGAKSISLAIDMPVEYAKLYAGARITNILYPIGSATDKVENIARDATVWVSENLEGAPVVSQPVMFSGDPGNMNTFKLATPYEITGDKDVYIGLTFEGGSYNNNSLPIVFSGMGGFTDCGCLLEAKNATGESSGWDDYSQQIGDLPLFVVLEGDNLPQNIVELWFITVPQYASMGNTFSATLAISNMGAAPVSTLDIAANTVGAPLDTPVHIELDPAFSNVPGVYGFTLSGVEPTKAGQGEYSVSITSVNGQPNNLTTRTTATAEQYVLPEGAGYKRMSVVEDVTGTWCGYCPAAYTVMENMRESHKDYGFIGIGVHGSVQGGADPMNVISGGTYSGITEISQGSYPTIILNRETTYNYLQGEELGEAVKNNYEYQLSPVQVEAVIGELAGNRLTVTATVTSAVDSKDSRYLLSYVVTEDEVGPYMQTNNFSGNANAPYGWGTQPKSLPLLYNDVARYCYGYGGIRNSLPEVLEAGKSYEHTTKVSLAKVSNYDKYALNVFVIDTTTGAIVNATRVLSPTYTGVENVAEDGNGITVNGGTGCVEVIGTDDYEVYDLSGARVQATGIRAGVYVVRAGGEAYKVLVR